MKRTFASVAAMLLQSGGMCLHMPRIELRD